MSPQEQHIIEEEQIIDLHFTQRGMTKAQREIAERRRLRAIPDVQAVAAGHMQLTDAAKEYKVAKESIKLWVARLEKALPPDAMKKSRNYHRKVSLEQLRIIYNLGAKAAGFYSDLWDAGRFITAVKDTFHVEYSIISANRYMKEIDPEKKKRIHHPSGPVFKVKVAAVAASSGEYITEEELIYLHRIRTAMTKAQREIAHRRRMQAMADVQKVAAGEMKNAAVARKYMVTTKTVTMWVKGVKEHPGKITAKPRSGRPPRLKGERLEQLKIIYQLGAKASGFKTDLWSIARLKEVVQKTFGIEYGPTSVNRYLAKLDPTHEKRNPTPPMKAPTVAEAIPISI